MVIDNRKKAASYCYYSFRSITVIFLLVFQIISFPLTIQVIVAEAMETFNTEDEDNNNSNNNNVVYPIHQMKAGGWSEVDEKLLNSDERIQKAANFAYQNIGRDEISSNYSFLSSVLQERNQGEDLFTIRILRAYRQVVAGMNYKMILTILKKNDDECIGAFVVTVYDQFGTLQVTKWGKEITCEETKNII